MVKLCESIKSTGGEETERESEESKLINTNKSSNHKDKKKGNEKTYK
jgi:hypothetical protein